MAESWLSDPDILRTPIQTPISSDSAFERFLKVAVLGWEAESVEDPMKKIGRRTNAKAFRDGMSTDAVELPIPIGAAAAPPAEIVQAQAQAQAEAQAEAQAAEEEAAAPPEPARPAGVGIKLTARFRKDHAIAPQVYLSKEAELFLEGPLSPLTDRYLTAVDPIIKNADKIAEALGRPFSADSLEAFVNIANEKKGMTDQVKAAAAEAARYLWEVVAIDRETYEKFKAAMR
jgi:hypothetical protein